MAAGFADGSDDPVSATQRALAKAAASDAIFISLRADDALREAAAAAERISSKQPLGPLDGIPIAIKDNIDVQGIVTTAGSTILAPNAPAQADAPVVEALRQQGMVIIGKTNLSEFAFSGLGLNPHYGTPTADFGTGGRYAPGGSSAGSAVAVQRGIVPVALGTDTAGSVRVPAALTGIVGFKSSTERYDRRAVFPLSRTLDSLGPLARSVADCALLDAAMRGAPLHLPAPQSLSAINLVVDEGLLQHPELEPAVRDNLLKVTHVLQQRGAQVRTAKIPALHQALALIKERGWLGAIEGWSELNGIIFGPHEEQVDRRIRARLQANSTVTKEATDEIRAVRRQLIHAVADDLQGSILVTPTVLHGAPELAPLEADDALFARVNVATLLLTMLGSLLDMPGLALPSGANAKGLPTSVLFSMPNGADAALLRAGVTIEAALHEAEEG